ncbi:hypothetical protein PG987_003598 [Apiospora arundinis]
MDPVSAVGVAAAAAQFIAIGIKAARLCKEIRDNADCATDQNKALESLVREARDSRKELLSRSPQRVPRRISDLATKCTQAADELLQLLEAVRGAGANKNASTVRKLFRVMKEKKQIEKMERSIQDKEKLLQALLIDDIWQVLKRPHLFSTLDARVQEILEGLNSLQVASKTDNTQLLKEIETIPTKMGSRFDELETAVKARLDQTDQASARLHEESRHLDFHNEFMKSLFFPDMTLRESEIKTAAPGTLDWIYGQFPNTATAKNNSFEDKRISFEEFIDWLRYESSEYWISGKLGSGKSTLMSYIRNDRNTKKLLRVWSRDKDVLVLSFFFWRLGTELQNTMTGLLRSLLYQICEEKGGTSKDEICQFILSIESTLGFERHSIPTWTEKSLRVAFNVALSLVKDEHICIFIDGLDEYVGDYDDLFSFLRGIQEGHNIKLCVSSRPEVPLVRRLVHSKQLRLQDFNYADIWCFAKSRLESNNMDIQVIRNGSDYIATQIAQNAEGVFLWAILVTQAAIQGAESGDDADIILRRIAKTPKAIEDIFASMLGKIDEFHAESLMFYSRLLEIANSVLDEAPKAIYCREHILSVPVLTAARAGVTFESDTSFASLCQQTEWQVTARSAGLMEIRNRKRYGWEETNWKSGHDWVDSSELVETNVWAHGFIDQLQRQGLEHTTPYPSVLQYETRYVDWVHRSAYEALNDSQNVQKLSLPNISYEEGCKRLLESYLRWIAFAPSYGQIINGFYTTLTTLRVQNLFYILRHLEDEGYSMANSAAQQLFHMTKHMGMVDLRSGLSPENVPWPAYVVFWILCGQSLPSYIESHGHEAASVVRAILYRNGFLAAKASSIHLDLLDYMKSWSRAYVPAENSGYTTLLYGEMRVAVPYSNLVSYATLVGIEGSAAAREEKMVMAEFARLVKRSSPEELSLSEDYHQVQINHGDEELDQRSHKPLRINKLLDISRNMRLYLDVAGTKRLTIQFSAIAYHSYHDDLSADYDEGYEPLQLVCHPKPGTWKSPYPSTLGKQRLGELLDPIVLKPRKRTSMSLLRNLRLDRKISEDEPYESSTVAVVRCYEKRFLQCFRMVVEDIQTNEQQLSSTEQLLAFACICTDVLDLFRSMHSESYKGVGTKARWAWRVQ